MAQLQNEFSWSISRARLFEECLRKYYYYYYASWNGWEETGPEHARLCYRLKQIVDLRAWAGDISHRVIKAAITSYRMGRPLSLEAMQSMGRNLLNREWKESAESLWVRHPKKYVNLFEHYYNRTVSPEDRAATRQRVFDALQAFVDMGYAEELRSVSTEDWLSVEELDQFYIGDVKAWAVIDCAFRRGAEIAIYDWKTGRANGDEGASDQLVCYALFAAHKWSAPLQSIRVSAVYLVERSAAVHTVAAEQAIEFRERVFKDVAKMAKRLADPQRNKGREEDFPRTTNRALCARCGFFEVCFGDRSLVPPKE
ncbi:MAG: PD-(D/E)XK nuclease family protein [Candidatus Sumerlaeota bacterium]|nr:PD-(D/E)XK nuclease family protein [Candidatus Sumerlaeota bacterium]